MMTFLSKYSLEWKIQFFFCSLLLLLFVPVTQAVSESKVAGIDTIIIVPNISLYPQME